MGQEPNCSGDRWGLVGVVRWGWGVPSPITGVGVGVKQTETTTRHKWCLLWGGAGGEPVPVWEELITKHKKKAMQEGESRFKGLAQAQAMPNTRSRWEGEGRVGWDCGVVCLGRNAPGWGLAMSGNGHRHGQACLGYWAGRQIGSVPVPPGMAWQKIWCTLMHICTR